LDVEYERISWKGNAEKESNSISSFLYDELLIDSDERKIYLERQPTIVVEALGRLVSILLDKGVLNLDDLKKISGCDWGRKAESLVLKKEE
jgi:hypothetical protein